MNMDVIEQRELTDPRDIVRFRGRDLGRWPLYHALFMLLSAVVAANALIALGTLNFKVTTETVNLGSTPITRFVPLDPDAPRFEPVQANTKAVVVIAHGFVGSQQLMYAFAATLARNGYAATTFDFPGHGGDGTVFTNDQEPRLAALDRVVQDARQRWPNHPIVLLGHSMGAAAVVEYAHRHPEIAATIAVSLVAPAAPDVRNLLVMTGAWEFQGIKQTSAASVAGTVIPLHFYGDFAAGTARKLVWVPGAEHALVLWNSVSLREAVTWVDQLTNTTRDAPIYTDIRMPAIGVLVLGLIWFWWSMLFFVFRRPPATVQGAGLAWPRFLLITGLAALVTPLLLRFIPIGTLIPLEVGSYLALHFMVFGVLMLVGLHAAGAAPWAALRTQGWWHTIWPMLLFVAMVAVVLGSVTDHWWLNVWPPLRRVPWAFVLFALLVPFALADGWLTGVVAGRHTIWPGMVTKLAFLGSLGLAVLLNTQLFFLVLILPIIAAAFLLFGLMGERMTRRSGNPFPAALATVAMLAWLIAATFPLIR